jgi:hypothetical protein
MGELTLARRIAADLKVNGAVSRLPEFAAQLALISAVSTGMDICTICLTSHC